MLEIKRELTMTRLLTLTGPGGSGKTRLALEVARSLVGAYPDGVWLVELASISEAELVPQTVARILEIREQPGLPLTATLVDALRAKRMLLILDNCEHLVDAVGGLVALLLDSCPRLRILATSRETLRAVGEVIWPVSLLSVPDLSRLPTVAQLEGYESIRLFVDRARQRNPAFTLTPDNVQAVAHVCVRLEGFPLAIELAETLQRPNLVSSLHVHVGGSRWHFGDLQPLDPLGPVGGVTGLSLVLLFRWGGASVMVVSSFPGVVSSFPGVGVSSIRRRSVDRFPFWVFSEVRASRIWRWAEVHSEKAPGSG